MDDVDALASLFRFRFGIVFARCGRCGDGASLLVFVFVEVLEKELDCD